MEELRNNSTLGGEAETARYERLLGEAKSIRGVSLGKDAWRRLRRNWSATYSLYLLVILGVLVIFTPALPFQSPILQDLENRKTLPPNTKPLKLQVKNARLGKSYTLSGTLRTYREEGEQLRNEAIKEVETLKEEFKKLPGRDIPPFLQEELKAAQAKEQSANVKLDNKSENDFEKLLLEKVYAKKLAEHDAGHPFRKLWHNPGPLTRAFVHLRLAIFGDYCIPSIFGTDALGRDLLARVMWGARVSLAVGIVATFVSLLIGVTYGAISGYAGGWVDSIMMRIVDVMYSIPFIYIVIFVVSVLSAGKFKENVLDKYGISQIVIFYFLIGAIYWLTMARVVRGQVLSLKNEQFIDAARTTGASSARIIFRHLIPNVLGIVIVYLTLTIPSVMLFEAFLSFLGLGVKPPDVSWGLLMDEGVKVINPLKMDWWLVVFPGLTLSATLFALNFLGDGLRDAFDPRMKNK